VKEEYLNGTELEEEKEKQSREKYLNVDERIAIKLKQENRAFKVENTNILIRIAGGPINRYCTIHSIVLVYPYHCLQGADD
jgi:hypothetical protein